MLRHARTIALVVAAVLGTATAARAADTDADGISDADELAYGTDPDLADTDGDGRTDFEEIVEDGSDPLLVDTDGDGTNDPSDAYPTHNDQSDFGGGPPGTLNAPTARDCILSGECPHDAFGVCLVHGGMPTTVAIGGASGPGSLEALIVLRNDHNPWVERTNGELKAETGLGRGVVLNDDAQAREQLADARCRLDDVRLRASLGFRTATAADAGLTPWYHVCPRDRFLATVRRRLDEALPGLEKARELRKARREAIYAAMEELGLIKRTRGGR